MLLSASRLPRAALLALVATALGAPGDGVGAQAPQPCLVEDGDATVLVGPRVTTVNIEYAVQLRNGPTPLDVTAVEIFTGLRRGDTSVRLFRNDPRANQPGVLAATGSWWQSEAVGWQGARLPFALRIGASEVFWVVWQAATGSQIPVARVNRASGDVYRTRVNRGVWSAPMRQWDWKIRLDCGGRRPGQLRTLGFPCGSGGFAPILATSDPAPVIGNVLTFEVRNLRPGTTAWLGLATRGGTWGGLRPPVDLTRFGAPRCEVGANLEQGVLRNVDASGTASVPLGMPGLPGLVGTTFFAQWVALDPAANPLGVLTSLTAEARIGN